MCNRYRRVAGFYAYDEDWSAIKIPLRFPEAAPNLEPREDIRPTNTAPIFRPIDPADPRAGVGLYQARWDLVPFFWKKPLKGKFLATNARSETVATTAAFREPFKRRRCLVPFDSFYEWTGEKGAKTKWMFTPADGRWGCMAGLWDRATVEGEAIDSFTMLTRAAGPDMAPYHDRQVVIVPREHWGDWLDLERAIDDLIAEPPAGLLKVELAPPDAKNA